MAPGGPDELRQRLARLSKRLDELTAPGDKRARKRVFAAIGKLNKAIAQSSAAEAPRAPPDGSSTPAGPSGGGGKKRKGDAIAINRQIASLAKRKKLSSAEQLFARAIDDRVADVHTYTNMINAAVRCGQLERGLELLVRMQRQGPVPNVVAYTSMLKGYCAAGDLASARVLLDQMTSGAAGRARATPNLRTANTLLRGCVRTGDVGLATSTLRRMRDEWGCEPDNSSYEYVLVLLCQALRVAKARALLGRLERGRFRDSSAPAGGGGGVGGSAGGGEEGDTAAAGGSTGVHPSENPALFVALARAEALLGEWAAARASLERAQTLLRLAAPARALVRDTPRRAGGPTDAARAGGGGGGVHMTQRSIEAFLAHRRAELGRDAETLLEMIDRAAGAEGAGDADGARAPDLGRCYGRTLCLLPHDGGAVIADADEEQPERSAGADGHGADEPPPRALARRCTRALAASFGLRAWLAQQARAAAGGGASDAAAPPSLGAFRSALARSCFTPDGMIDYAGLFGARGAARRGAPRERRLNLELCAGSGEWVAEQAAHDADCADWVAVELRADRAQHIFARMALARARNLAVVCADARELLERRTPPAVFDAVCVNHPQPPEWSGGVGDSDGDHLLSGSFLRLAHGALRRGGTLTVVTDNVRYGRSLASTIGALEDGGVALFVPLDTAEAHAVRSTAEAQGEARGPVPLCAGQPPPVCGYGAVASSYFNRLWANGKRVKRYFIAVAKA